MVREEARLVVDDPYRGDVAVELPLLSAAEAREIVARAAAAQAGWARVPLGERVRLVEGAMDALERRGEEIARDVVRQMGKPLAQARAEVRTCLSRARHLAAAAPEALAPELVPSEAGFAKRITHEPAGVVLVISAWNYPLLVAVNVVVPAVLAGDAVLIKPSPRTPLCAGHFARAFREAGAPDGLVEGLLADHDVVAEVMQLPAIGFVSFTGSMRGGREVHRVAARRSLGVALELGGKDPAYVAEDADLDHAVANVVDGALYNAGQSCCAVERAYVHRSLYDAFLEGAVRLAAGYRLGDPLDERTTLGPMALPAAPAFLAAQVDEARREGARVLCGGHPTSAGGGRFFAPTIVAEAGRGTSLMREESFGPVLAVAPVDGDEEAVRLMNDCAYGLTASIWSRDPARAERLGERLEAGTIFLNRCDYVDPALAWTGWKDSGLGASLSRYGFHAVTRRKSWHFRLASR